MPGVGVPQLDRDQPGRPRARQPEPATEVPGRGLQRQHGLQRLLERRHGRRVALRQPKREGVEHDIHRAGRRRARAVRRERLRRPRAGARALQIRGPDGRAERLEVRLARAARGPTAPTAWRRRRAAARRRRRGADRTRSVPAGARPRRPAGPTAVRPRPRSATRSAASSAPASRLARAAASRRRTRSAGSGVSVAALSRKAADAAMPPRASARAAERSSSSATCSSGPGAAWARCHARRSGSVSASVASASAACSAERSAGDAERYAAERASGWRNRIWGRISSRSASTAGVAASGSIPSRSAARHTQQRLAHRIGRGELQQPAGVGRQRVEPAPEAVLDAVGQPDRRGRREAARQLGRAHAARQLQQGERIAARLGDDPVTNALVDPARDDRLEQRACVGVVEPAQRPAPADPPAVLAGLADGEHERHRLRQQPARDELEHQGRGIVEPLEIVHDAQQRPRLGHAGDQPERGQRDEEAVGRLAGREPQRDPEGDLLRLGQRIQLVEHRRAQLVQSRVRQLHLGLDAGDLHDPEAGGLLDDVAAAAPSCRRPLRRG